MTKIVLTIYAQFDDNYISWIQGLITPCSVISTNAINPQWIHHFMGWSILQYTLWVDLYLFWPKQKCINRFITWLQYHKICPLYVIVICYCGYNFMTRFAIDFNWNVFWLMVFGPLHKTHVLLTGLKREYSDRIRCTDYDLLTN